MKRLFSTLIIFSISINIFAHKLEEYLIPTPQKIQYLKSKNGNETAQFEVSDIIKDFEKLHILKIDGTFRLSEKVQFLMIIDSTNIVHDGYKLFIEKNRIKIIANNQAGLFYAKQTLRQLFEYSISEKCKIPCLEIIDAPDFAKRGYMLDISRDKVPTMESIFKMIDMIASFKINELQLYTEHTFAYKNHKIVWKNASPLTADEIRQIDAYCKERFIDLVPNQNSFGHMENWLKHDEYLYLAECPEDCKTIWGNRKRSSLNPLNEGSLKLMSELYAELIPNFSSEYINIGCDETVELGQGLSKDECAINGKGKIYLDFLKKLNNEVKKNGKKAQFWGDIILNHPELIDSLPKDMTAMVWGYTTDYPFKSNLPKFQKSGLDFYVCPGTSAWCSLLGRNHDAFINIRNAAVYGKKFGAKGILTTDWGDYGHWQPTAVSIPAIMIGAAYSWNINNTNCQNIEFELNKYIFKDSTENTGKAIMALSDTYRQANIPEGNANVFHLMLHRYKWTMKGQYQTKLLTIKSLQKTEIAVDSALKILELAQPHCQDSSFVIDEMRLAADMAKHSLHLGMARLKAPNQSTENISESEKKQLISELTPIIERYKIIWKNRNRIGGLDDSVSKLEEILNCYQKKN